MKETIWPKLKPVTKNGKPMIMVDCRINGQGERKFFATKLEAEGEQQRQRIKRANEGNSAFDFPQEMRIDAMKAMKELAPLGVSLLESAKFYKRHAATATNK